MKKRRWMLGSAIMLAVLLVAGGTLAWFTATADPVENKFTAGTLDIKLIDEFDGAPNVNPGDCYDKVVKIENLGSKRAFVRIKKDMTFTPELPLDVVRYGLGENWVEHDGYFYYTQELAANDGITTNLFADISCAESVAGRGIGMERLVRCPVCGRIYSTWLGHCCPGPCPDPDQDPDPENPEPPTCVGNICFSTSMGNEYQGAEFNINIAPEAIQVTNDAALTVWGVNPLDL